MAVEDEPQAAAAAAANGGGGIEEELAVVRRLCFAAESPRELRRAVEVRAFLDFIVCVCVHVYMIIMKPKGYAIGASGQ
jgi:RNase P/RNase MRP subunit p30